MVSICTTLARDWDIICILEQLSKQTYKDFEWVIVDFMYEYNRHHYAQLAYEYDITLIHVPRVDSFKYIRDIAQNRNLAVSKSSGNHIIFLDDHSFIDTTFVEEHLLVKGISCGQMYYLTNPKDTSRNWLQKGALDIDSILDSVKDILYDSRRSLLISNEPVTPVLGPEWTYTGNLSFSKEVFNKLGGFDPILSSRGEDGDFGLRADALGIPILYNHRAKSINFNTDSIPCVNVFDHVHDLKALLKNSEKIQRIGGDYFGYTRTNKYNCSTAICTLCGAEFILNPAKYIYAKLENKEFVVKNNQFLKKE